MTRYEDIESFLESSIARTIRELELNVRIEDDDARKAAIFCEIANIYSSEAKKQKDRQKRTFLLDHAESCYLSSFEIYVGIQKCEESLMLFSNWLGTLYENLYLLGSEYPVRDKLVPIAQKLRQFINLSWTERYDEVITMRENLAVVYEEIAKSYEKDGRTRDSLEYYEKSDNQLENAEILINCLCNRNKRGQTLEKLEGIRRRICQHKYEICQQIEIIRKAREDISDQQERD